MTMPVQSLYVHVPFCRTICGYCDFYSQVFDRRAVTPLVDALLTELDWLSERHSLQLRTVFVGGGTPTTLPPAELQRLLGAIHRHLDPTGGPHEFTVEANPATVTPDVAAALVECGVNRVSIGAQSFQPGELRVLDRVHAPHQVPQTVAMCRESGIAQVNLDLIFAIPGQSLESWLRNLSAALELRPDHLSCYALTYEPGTPLYERLQRGEVRRLPDELEADMFEATIDRLAEAGFEQYEISNFARPFRQCRHNLAYWRAEPCAAVGPSASGYIDGERYRNVPDTAHYVRAVQQGLSPRTEVERLEPERRAREAMVLGLRTLAGVDRGQFRTRYGEDPAAWFREAVDRHVELGTLVVDEAVKLTRRGLLLADSVMVDFV